MTDTTTVDKKLVEELFSVGAHFGHVKSRRHPSMRDYIFGIKNKIEIFDLEKTSKELEALKEYVATLGQHNKVVLIVGSKNEAHQAVRTVAESLNLPYVAGRFVGGTLTNFAQIKKRIAKLDEMRTGKESGAWDKYTKKEQLLMSRELTRLETLFGGVSNLTGKPDAVFVIDPGKEHIVVNEARLMGVPVIALAGSDCDISGCEQAFPGNDSSLKSIEFVLNYFADAYKSAKK
jgi:small subunit ribosomal protein S2